MKAKAKLHIIMVTVIKENSKTEKWTVKESIKAQITSIQEDLATENFTEKGLMSGKTEKNIKVVTKTV
jgi:hypothetical protein